MSVAASPATAGGSEWSAACADDTVQTGDEQNVTQRTGGEVELYRSAADSQYRFRVKAANGEIILASEGYVGKGGAMFQRRLLDGHRGGDACGVRKLVTKVQKQG